MPTYEYACTSCGQHVEIFQRLAEPPLETCVACGGHMRKVFFPAGIVFKGSGFYATDSRSKSKSSASSDSGSASSGSDSGSGSGSGSGSDGKKTDASKSGSSGTMSPSSGSSGSKPASKPAAKEKSA